MTELIYLKDTYLFDFENAKIQELWENEFGKYIILDKTIFYPQGWWQPSDNWIIFSNSWKFIVDNVRLIEWQVFHYGQFDNWVFQLWDLVDLQIDRDKRIINAKNHSAGHLIDIAMKNIWFLHLNPTKWFHFPVWSYVEYEWTFVWDKQELVYKLNEELKKLIWKNIKVIVDEDRQDISPPNWKKPRYVYFDWYEGCGCWWTHVESSMELWEIVVKKIKSKWNILKVSYEVI